MLHLPWSLTLALLWPSFLKSCTFKELFPDVPLRLSSVLLKTYSGERLSTLGDMDVTVQYEQQQQDLVLTVVAGEGSCLLGRNWLRHLTHNWREIKAGSQHAVGSLDYILDKYGNLHCSRKASSSKGTVASVELAESPMPTLSHWFRWPFLG